jgi:pectin-derived oligosaccharide transport system substrate-binding protein
MLNRRQLIVTAALGAASTALTGCGGSSDSAESDSGSASLTLAFWGAQERATKYQQAAELFQKANPTITVKTSFAAWADYWSQRATEAAGSSLPDVFQMDLAYLTQYGGTHQLLKLDPYLGKGLNVSGIDKSVLPSGQIGGATYAIPTGTNVFGLYYNPALVAKLGMTPPENLTMTQYQAWISEASAKGASMSPPVYGSGDYTGALWIFIHNLRQQGKKAFTDAGKLGFTEKDLAAWWSSTSSMRGAKAFISAQETAGYLPVSVFAKLRVAAEFTWDNQLAGYVSDSGGAQFTLVKPPSDTANSGLFYKASMLLSAGQNTRYPKQAAKLIDFLINDPEVGKIFGTSKGIPVTAAQRDAIPTTGTDGQVMAYETSVKGVVGTAQGALPKGYGTIETDFKRLCEQINYGKISVDKAASDWYAAATETLGK